MLIPAQGEKTESAHSSAETVLARGDFKRLIFTITKTSDRLAVDRRFDQRQRSPWIGSIQVDASPMLGRGGSPFERRSQGTAPTSEEGEQQEGDACVLPSTSGVPHAKSIARVQRCLPEGFRARGAWADSAWEGYATLPFLSLSCWLKLPLWRRPTGRKAVLTA